MQSGLLPKYSLLTILKVPCESQNLVAEQCRMADLRCRVILPVLACVFVCQFVGKREYAEKEIQIFYFADYI